MKIFQMIPLVASLLPGLAAAAEPTNHQIRSFRAGDLQAISEYVGAPAILVSVYQVEQVPLEGTLSKHCIVRHARVVGSAVPEIPFGCSVIIKTLQEGEPRNLLKAKGELYYVFAPGVRSEHYWTQERELHEGAFLTPLEGSAAMYELAWRMWQARQP